MGNCVTTKTYAGFGILFLVAGVVTLFVPHFEPNLGIVLLAISILMGILMAAYRVYHSCNNASTESAPLLYTATAIAVPPTTPSAPPSYFVPMMNSTAPTAPTSSTSTDAETLAEAKQLLDLGVLSQDEFDEMRNAYISKVKSRLSSKN